MDGELPPLEPMTMVETADTGGPADGTEQQAEGLDALSRALGVPFLWAEGARENPYTRVSYQNFGGEYQIVKAKAYLVGDLRTLSGRTNTTTTPGRRARCTRRLWT